MQTPLDAAQFAVEAAPEDDRARLAFLERLAEAELYLWLEREPEGDVLEPKLFELSGGPVVLAFDLEERLAAFAEGPAVRAVLSGRALAALLAGRGLGLGLNLGDAPSAQILAPEALDWLAGIGQAMLSQSVERPERLDPPRGDAALRPIARKLALAAGMAAHAWLVAAHYRGGRQGPLLVIVDARPGAEPALAAALAEAARFADGALDGLELAFARAGDALETQARAVGLRLDLPARPGPSLRQAPPGSDASRPPRLR
ncbi:MAG: SseB family protein [Rhodobacteraceae bacterium]|nr:SseB family protein [Paracoccaceae bacterium]